MRDSLQQIGKGHAHHEHGDDGLALHLTKSGIPMERGVTSTMDSSVMELEKVRSRA